MAELLQSETSTTDPRILRSRRMLMDSLAKLLTKKEFEEISIQEIADEATLNRATFYLHYPDKNALLQAMTAVRFRALIERRAITFTDCIGALRAIALGVALVAASTAVAGSTTYDGRHDISIIRLTVAYFVPEGPHPAAGLERPRRLLRPSSVRLPNISLSFSTF